MFLCEFICKVLSCIPFIYNDSFSSSRSKVHINKKKWISLFISSLIILFRRSFLRMLILRILIFLFFLVILLLLGSLNFFLWFWLWFLLFQNWLFHLFKSLLMMSLIEFLSHLSSCRRSSFLRSFRFQLLFLFADEFIAWVDFRVESRFFSFKL